MFDIIGKSVNVVDYLKSSDGKMTWTPQFIVLHNTAEPTLAQRPNGFTEQQMINLQGYYSGMGWKGGPHFFVDQDEVWAFNPITKRGTHSPSWNSKAIGVEMLGDYNIESFSLGGGLKVKNVAMDLLAKLCDHFDFDPSTIRLHKEDPETTHDDCPGKNVSKSDVINCVTNLMVKHTKIVIYRKGYGHDPVGVVDGTFKNGSNYTKVEDLKKIVGFDNGFTGVAKVADVLKGKYTFSWDEKNLRLYCVEI